MPFSMIRRNMNPDAVVRMVGDGMLPAGTARIMRGQAGQYVIETAAPDWKDGMQGEEYQLRSCYRTSLALALEYGCETVEVPILADPACPEKQAVQIAVEEAEWFLKNNELSVFLMMNGRESFVANTELFKEVLVYIRDHYEEPFFPDIDLAAPSAPVFGDSFAADESSSFDDGFAPGGYGINDSGAAFIVDGGVEPELDELLRATDESFTEALFRLIDERGMTDAQCYKKANVDRKLFSKIRSNIWYRPSKPTVCAFAVALELPLDEAKDLIEKAGYSLTHSSRFDIIVEYFLKKRYYSVTQINEILFEYDLPLLGSSVA